jgi:GT2 family glycosyltransferase
MPELGIIIIGRNEGERLRRCLASVGGADAVVVYVDSGSSDGSVKLARQMGAQAVELDLDNGFSAARARNAGFDHLMRGNPSLQLVQFIDGDCELNGEWMTKAREALLARPDVAVVCGRRRERHPEASVYNRLCDMEWNTPSGEVKACGGDSMMRVAALQQVGGFDPTVIAGEEPELCLRLRRQHWKILRLDAEMTLHDAAMTRFSQWWKRAVRGGYAYALGARMHGASPERHWVRQNRSNWFWGLILPALAAGLAWPTKGLSLLLLVGYPLLGWRIGRHMRGRGFSIADARLYAAFCVLSKFPQVQGQLKFWLGVARSRPSRIIEHKALAPTPGLLRTDA